MSEPESNYAKYRGKCKQMCEESVAEDPSLRIVRGHYWCPVWNTQEAHWWTVRPDGTIFDPTAIQFPSSGAGDYTEFDGMCSCSECGKKVPEAEAETSGNYAFCSYTCHGRFVGAF